MLILYHMPPTALVLERKDHCRPARVVHVARMVLREGHKDTAINITMTLVKKLLNGVHGLHIILLVEDLRLDMYICRLGL